MISIRIAVCLLVGLASAAAAQEPKDPKARGQKGEKPRWLVDLPADFVQYARVPDGGRMPRVVPGKDALVLLYFKGEGARGDLFLTRSTDEAKSFTPSLPVESESGVVRSWEGLHSGSIALGPDGRARLCWVREGERPTLCYRAETAEGLGEIVELGAPPGLCGPTAVAADAEGRVFVFFAAGESEESPTQGLRVRMRRSLDGRTFEEPVVIDRAADGFSPLSAMAAHVDSVMGTIFVLYRSAMPLREDKPKVSRSMRLLNSRNHGDLFDSGLADNWPQPKDPHSSATLSQETNTTLASWEAGGKPYWSLIRRQELKMNLPMEVKDDERAFQRTQVAAAASQKEILVAWLERPRSDPAGPHAIGWHVWLIEGKQPLGQGQAPGPAIDGPAVFARRDRGFTVLY